jgi:transcriptional regulator with XRE-family HTH domain
VETLGERLRATRESQGMTVAALANAAGVSEALVRQVEAGTVRVPSLVTGLRFAKALDIDPYWLATGQEDTVEGRLARLETVVRWLQEKVAPTTAKRR